MADLRTASIDDLVNVAPSFCLLYYLSDVLCLYLCFLSVVEDDAPNEESDPRGASSRDRGVMQHPQGRQGKRSCHSRLVEARERAV